MLLQGGHTSDDFRPLLRVMNLTSGDVSIIAGRADARGTEDGRGDVATFQGLRGMAISADKTFLYLTDYNNIRKVTLPSGGADPMQPSSYYVCTLLREVGLGRIEDVFLDPAGRLIFTDSDSGREYGAAH